MIHTALMKKKTMALEITSGTLRSMVMGATLAFIHQEEAAGRYRGNTKREKSIVDGVSGSPKGTDTTRKQGRG